MSTADCCLTIVLPQSLEEDFVDHLLEHPEWVGGFVIARVDGSGQSVQLRGLGEMVRGRSRRLQLQIVMPRAHAAALIDSHTQLFGGPGIFWWITPVLDSGGPA